MECVCLERGGWVGGWVDELSLHRWVGGWVGGRTVGVGLERVEVRADGAAEEDGVLLGWVGGWMGG